MGSSFGSPRPDTGAQMAVAELAGLDALDLADAGSRKGRLAARAWQALWPKLLAVALVLAIWELIHLTGWKELVLPGPGVTLSNLWAQAHTSLLWHAIGTTLERALIGFTLAVVIGVVIGG